MRFGAPHSLEATVPNQHPFVPSYAETFPTGLTPRAPVRSNAGSSISTAVLPTPQTSTVKL